MHAARKGSRILVGRQLGMCFQAPGVLGSPGPTLQKSCRTGLRHADHGLIGKQNMYDHSVRVLLIVNGPGVPAGGRNSTAVYLQDLMPTSLELAGVPRPAHVRFNSLMPLVRGEAFTPYGAIYGAYL